MHVKVLVMCLIQMSIVVEGYIKILRYVCPQIIQGVLKRLALLHIAMLMMTLVVFELVPLWTMLSPSVARGKSRILHYLF